MPDDPKPYIPVWLMVCKKDKEIFYWKARWVMEERARIKKIHETHRGMDWGVNEELFWKEVEGD